MSDLDRTIRVFISSTFRDMQQERDALTKVVFPNLRERFKDLNIELLDIDLRWGISTEQEENETINTCFQCIDECTPYFIGVLGRRYGWVPNSLPNEFLEKNTWLKNPGKKSITELEILYGAFNPNRTPAEHNTHFFYFRNSSKKDDKQLTKLKDRIRKKAEKNEVSLMDGYKSIDEFRTRVYEDLEKMIEAKFSKKEKMDSFQEMREKQHSYLEKQTRFYIPSEKEQKKIQKFVDGNERALFVTGESGLGKSSFIANWIDHYTKTNPNPSTHILYHFVGADFENASALKIFQQTVREIATLYGIEYEFLSNKLVDAQRDFFEILQSVPKTEKLLLFIDGINQLESQVETESFIFSLNNLPSNVKLIVSATTDLETLAIQNSWNIHHLEYLEKKSKEILITQYFKRYKKDFKDEFIEQIASEKITSHPLYLTKLIEEIRLLDNPYTMGEKIDNYLKSESAIELLEKIIHRLSNDYSFKHPEIIANTLGSLFITKYGLSVMDLRKTIDKDIPSINWVPFFINIQTYLIHSSGRYTLFHDGFREAVRNLFLPDQQTINKFRRLLIDIYVNEAKENKKWEHVKALEVIYQLEKLEDWSLLYQYISDIDFVCAAIDVNEDGISEAWDYIEEHTSLQLSVAYQRILDNPKKYKEEDCWKLAQLFMGRGFYKEALQLRSNTTTLLHTNETLKIREHIVKYEQNIKALMKDRKHHQAESILLTLSKIYKQILSLKGTAYCLKNLGVIYTQYAETPNKEEDIKTDYLTMALKAFMDEEKINHLLNEDKELPFSYANIADVYNKLGDYQNALTYRKKQEQQLLMDKKMNTRLSLAHCLNYQAILYMKLGEQDLVDETIKNSIDILPENTGIRMVFFGKAFKNWRREGFGKHANHFKLKELYLLRETDNYRELVNCLSILARNAAYNLSKPYTAFLFTMEAIIYLKVLKEKREIKFQSSLLQNIIDIYNISLFREIANELFDVPDYHWTDKKFREDYLTEIKRRIKEVSDEPHDELDDDSFAEYNRESILSTLNTTDIITDKSERVALLVNLESHAFKKQDVEIQEMIYEKVVPDLHMTNPNRMPFLLKWEALLKKSNNEAKLAICLFELANTYMASGEKYLALKAFFDQMRMARKVKNHYFYSLGRTSYAWLLKSTGNIEGAINALLTLEKHMNKSQEYGLVLKCQQNLQTLLNIFYRKYPSIQHKTSRNYVLDYYISQPMYKQVGTHLLKVFILDIEKKYEEAAHHCEQINQLYRKSGVVDLYISTLEKNIHFLRCGKQRDAVIEKYKELLMELGNRNNMNKITTTLKRAIDYCKQNRLVEEETYFSSLLQECLMEMENEDQIDQQVFRLQVFEDNDKGNESIIHSILNQQLDSLERSVDTKVVKAQYHKDNMIPLSTIRLIGDSFYEIPSKQTQEEYIEFYNQNGLLPRPIIIKKDHTFLCEMDVYEAAKKLELSQVPIIYKSEEQLLKLKLKEAENISHKRDFTDALRVMAIHQRLADQTSNVDQILEGAALKATIYRKMGIVEKALLVLKDCLIHIKESEQENHPNIKLIRSLSAGFYKKYKSFFNENVDPFTSYQLITEDSPFYKIGNLLEKAYFHITEGDIVEAIKNHEEIGNVYREMHLEGLVQLNHEKQISILENSQEYDLFYSKITEYLGIHWEKGKWMKFRTYLAKAEAYFMEHEQYKYGYIFNELKKMYSNFYDFNQEIAATLEETLNSIENKDSIMNLKQETSLVSIKLEEIIVPDHFSQPNPVKVEKKKRDYIKNEGFLKPIICDSDFIILDGYAAYLAAKELELPEILVKVIY